MANVIAILILIACLASAVTFLVRSKLRAKASGHPACVGCSCCGTCSHCGSSAKK